MSVHSLNTLNGMKSKQYWKQKVRSQLQKRQVKKQIFGQHYNYEAIRMNRNKKYFNQQVKIMEIQRSNRILLEKIKKIAQRSKPKCTLQSIILNTNVAMNHYIRVHTQGQKNHLISKHTQNQNQQNSLHKNHRQYNKNQLIQRSQTEHQLLNQIKYNTTKLKNQRYNTSNDTSNEALLDKTRVKNKQKSHQRRRASQMQISQFVRINQNKTINQKIQKIQNEELQKDNHRIIIYRGKRTLQKIRFSFTIFIQNKVFNILSQTKISKQKIQIPLNNYKVLLKQQLKDDHLNIFNLLKVNQDNKLSFIGTKKIQMDLIEKEELILPIINGEKRKDTIVDQMQNI